MEELKNLKDGKDSSLGPGVPNRQNREGGDIPVKDYVYKDLIKLKEDVDKKKEQVSREEYLKQWNKINELENRIYKMETYIIKDPQKVLTLERLNNEFGIFKAFTITILTIFASILVITLNMMFHFINL